MKKVSLPAPYLRFITSIMLFASTLTANAYMQDWRINSAVSDIGANLNQDSLPAGITPDLLKDLRDENGNRIFNGKSGRIPVRIPEDPEGDALQQNIFAGVSAGDNYGRSVANAGDVNGDGFDDIMIGAPNNNAGGTNGGRVYIYFGGTVIDNSADVTLTAPANNYAGISVSSAGDVNGDGFDDVIVGAHGVNLFTGRAYICYGGSPMNSVADVILEGESAGHEFGKSVSGAGDLNGDGYDDVIVGAHAANAYTGKGYIFYGGPAMNNTADLVMSGELTGDEFGISVSGAGDVNADGFADAIIGAMGNNSSIGKCYIYLGGSSMDNVSDITMTGEGIVNFFGASVAGAGDVNDDGYSDVIVGAYGYNSFAGRSYIYFGGSSMNGISDVIMTGESNSSFGYSVHGSGDINGDGFSDVIIGAYGYSVSSGRSFVYYGGSSMNNTVDLYMTGDTALNYFGYSLSGGGDFNGDGFDDMVVGAYGNSSNKGKAYVYTNTLTGEDISDICINGESPDDNFGHSVSSAGDVNGDGYDDMIVGAWNHNATAFAHPGRAYLYFGGLMADNIADLVFDGEEGFAEYYGWSVSGAGDVNADGFDDIVILGFGYGWEYSVQARIYFGGAAMNNAADVFLTYPSWNLDMSVSGAGDVNGDGYDDVIAGAPNYLSTNAGYAYVYFGGAPMDSIVDVTLEGEEVGDLFGYSVSDAGDVNADGFADVIVGAFANNSVTGKAYLFFGGNTMDNFADVTFSGQDTGSSFGATVSSAGDIDNDGFGDVVVGAPRVNSYTGKAFIYKGGNAMNNVPDLILSGETSESGFGTSVSGAGDVNGDGIDDVVIGARRFNSYKGRAYVYFGGMYMNSGADVIMNGEGANDHFGVSVSGDCDINGDGHSDLIVGSRGYKGGTNQGRACIYLSSPPDNRMNLLLYGAIQGMYNPVSNTQMPDSVRVYLRNSSAPYAIIDSSLNILLGPGTGQNFIFKNVQNGIPYFVVVKHRNALETWSASPVTFVNREASIAFSVDAIYAYGNNEIQVDSSPYNVFAFYSGDVNQDGTIDATDISMIDNDAANFTSGYVATDLTGDDFVDGTDFVIADNNAADFVSVVKP